MKPKFKYILHPDNLYIIDYGEFQAEIWGKEIMAILKSEKYLNYEPVEDYSSNEDSISG